MDDYATGDLLGYLNDQSYYKLIGKYFLRQKNTSITQQINFTGKLEKMMVQQKINKKLF